MRLLERSMSDIAPRGKWVELSRSDLADSDLSRELFDLIQTAYKPIGGHLKIKSPSDIASLMTYVTAIDIDDDPEADAVVFGKTKSGKVKISGMGHDGSGAGKHQSVKKAGDLLRSGRAFAEVSGAPAHIFVNKMDLPTLGQSAVEKLLGQRVEWVGERPDGRYPDHANWYYRTIGGKKVMKTMVGLESMREVEGRRGKIRTSKLEYVHFTDAAGAVGMVREKRIWKCDYVDGVFAVPVGGSYVPGVQRTKMGRADARDVAVVFTTDELPDSVSPEEVVWHQDEVRIKKARIVSASKAMRLLDGSLSIEDGGFDDDVASPLGGRWPRHPSSFDWDRGRVREPGRSAATTRVGEAVGHDVRLGGGKMAEGIENTMTTFEEYINAARLEAVEIEEAGDTFVQYLIAAQEQYLKDVAKVIKRVAGSYAESIKVERHRSIAWLHYKGQDRNDMDLDLTIYVVVREPDVQIFVTGTSAFRGKVDVDAKYNIGGATVSHAVELFKRVFGPGVSESLDDSRVEAEADYDIKQKPGEDYWYIKRGAVTFGVISKDDEGKFDADTDPSGGGKYRQGFDSKEAAAKWAVSMNNKLGATDESLISERQKGNPSFGAEGGEHRLGAFKLSQGAIDLFKSGGITVDQTLFKDQERVMNSIPREDLAAVLDEENIPDAQDELARNPNGSFQMFLRNIGRVSPKAGRMVRAVPENAAIYFYIFMLRLSGRMMADEILKRYFTTYQAFRTARESIEEREETVFDKPQWIKDFKAGWEASKKAKKYVDPRSAYKAAKVSKKHGNFWIDGYGAFIDHKRGATAEPNVDVAKKLGLIEALAPALAMVLKAQGNQMAEIDKAVARVFNNNIGKYIDFLEAATGLQGWKVKVNAEDAIVTFDHADGMTVDVFWEGDLAGGKADVTVEITAGGRPTSYTLLRRPITRAGLAPAEILGRVKGAVEVVGESYRFEPVKKRLERLYYNGNMLGTLELVGSDDDMMRGKSYYLIRLPDGKEVGRNTNRNVAGRMLHDAWKYSMRGESEIGESFENLIAEAHPQTVFSEPPRAITRAVKDVLDSIPRNQIGEFFNDLSLMVMDYGNVTRKTHGHVSKELGIEIKNLVEDMGGAIDERQAWHFGTLLLHPIWDGSVYDIRDGKEYVKMLSLGLRKAPTSIGSLIDAVRYAGEFIYQKNSSMMGESMGVSFMNDIAVGILVSA